MNLDIKNKEGVVIFSHHCENNTIAKTVQEAVGRKVNLRRASLSNTNLSHADLSDVNLSHADLRRANLSHADLRHANLRGAHLSNANLSNADLRGVDLIGVNFNGEILTKPPISIGNLEWAVLITDGYMRIGCQRHTHKDWLEFDEIAIVAMHSEALVFWKKFGHSLLAMCDAHHEPTGE